ncbi:anhydro-N-acetylmuramic acid kinase [Actibacterium lipolyticum]|uniref:Anhydro-N-acetylmuramic acid kinase n=1 Tax=Actibacterium lipolyticum TaxID=1524263 RepID=A0A238KIJ6_9RHOB|nr:anhydro-N-acetylmuramic acid kinase [Actibacterium lipolyticum]SMX41926.1 Anhydro-N-acetylmuramic acid kinase [Actibacterium lipolyticum]
MLKAGPIRALGAMSGTSLDGVDAAVVETDGEVIFSFGETAYRPYSDAEREVISAALGQWHGDENVEAAAEVVETAHAEILSGFEGVGLIGFHGQTLAHAPRAQGTHQAGDGRVIAEVLGCPVVWDFRSSDVEMGGEGAPLAPFFHFACAKWIGSEVPLVFVNLGGVGNITWVDPSKRSPDSDGALVAFDTGPANAPLNDLMQTRLKRDFDEGGALAGEGTVDEDIVQAVLALPYFCKLPPKSLDRDDFTKVLGAVDALGDADAAATLTAVAAACVARGLEHCPQAPESVLITGGGRHNPVMMRMLEERAGLPVLPVEEVGLDGDMLEAQAFAYLAVRVKRGLPTSCPATTGVAAAVGGGRVSRPTGL